LCLFGDLVDGMSEVVDIFGGDSDNRDSAVFGEVDRVLLDELLDLIRGHPGVAEHPNLVRDVRPIPGGSFLLQVISQLVTHVYHPICHLLHLRQPLSTEGGIVEDF